MGSPKHQRAHFSLFSGAGGLDVGLESAGFETRLCIENDKSCAATLHLNCGRINGFKRPQDLQILQEDITRISDKGIFEYTDLEPGEIALVSGGPPCQPYSTAGKRESVEDPRGGLFKSFIDIIKDVRPRFFIMENVRGLESAAVSHRPLHLRNQSESPLREDEVLGSAFKDRLLPEFEKLDYELIYGRLNALDYGAAQHRERFFILGSRDWEFPKRKNGKSVSIHALVRPTHHPKGQKGLTKYRNLSNVIGDLRGSEPGPCSSYSAQRKEIYKHIPMGKNWVYIRETPDLFPPDYLEDVMGGAYKSGGGKVGFFRRLSWDKYAPTLTTSPTQKATGLCHPEEHRPLSVKEYARIQGFSDDWEFSGSVTSQYKQIGNAVPKQLGEAIGESLMKLIEKNPAG